MTIFAPMLYEKYKPFYKRNFNLAVPVMITQAGQMVVQIADNIMVGHLGTTEFAGVSFANVIFMIGMVFTICFTQGLTPYVGQNYGRGNHRDMKAYLQDSFILNLIICLFVLTLMTLIVPFMDQMGQDPKILLYAKQYYLYSLVSLIPTVLFFTMRNFSEGIGITKYAMYITVFANLLNILLNWLLIFGKWGFPYLGVSGAAIATLISRIVMVILFAYIFFRIEAYTKFTKIKIIPFIDLDKMKKLFNTSIPIAFQGLVEVTAFGLTGIMVGWINKESLAAYQITNTLSTLSFMIAQGIGVAATITVSHQFGEKNYSMARNAGFAATHLAVLFMGTAGIIYILFRSYIPMIFTSDDAVIELTAKMLIISAAFQVFDATQLSGFAGLRALKDVKIPLLFSTISYYFICLPLSYFFGFILGIGAVGVWLGLLFGLILVAIASQYRFHKLTLRLIKNSNESIGD